MPAAVMVNRPVPTFEVPERHGVGLGNRHVVCPLLATVRLPKSLPALASSSDNSAPLRSTVRRPAWRCAGGVRSPGPRRTAAARGRRAAAGRRSRRAAGRPPRQHILHHVGRGPCAGRAGGRGGRQLNLASRSRRRSSSGPRAAASLAAAAGEQFLGVGRWGHTCSCIADLG